MEAEEQACDLDDDEGEDDGGGDADEAVVPFGWEQLKFPHLLEGIPKEWQGVASEGGGTGWRYHIEPRRFAFLIHKPMHTRGGNEKYHQADEKPCGGGEVFGNNPKMMANEGAQPCHHSHCHEHREDAAVLAAGGHAVQQERCHHARHHQRRVSPATRPERQEYVATEILLWNDATLGVDDAKQHHGTPCAEGVAQA